MLPFVCRLRQVACSKDMRATLLISQETEVDVLVKSPEMKCSVIPVKAGIQSLRLVINHLDSGDPVPAKARNRSDDFLRSHQN